MNTGKEREMKDRYSSQLESLEEEKERACTRLDMVHWHGHGHGPALPFSSSFFFFFFLLLLVLVLLLLLLLFRGKHTSPVEENIEYVCMVDDINGSKVRQREERGERRMLS